MYELWCTQNGSAHWSSAKQMIFFLIIRNWSSACCPALIWRCLGCSAGTNTLNNLCAESTFRMFFLGSQWTNFSLPRAPCCWEGCSAPVLLTVTTGAFQIKITLFLLVLNGDFQKYCSVTLHKTSNASIRLEILQVDNMRAFCESDLPFCCSQVLVNNHVCCTWIFTLAHLKSKLQKFASLQIYQWKEFSSILVSLRAK